MKKKTILLLLTSLFLIIAISSNVYAQNPLRTVANALGGLNIGETYSDFPYFFDGVIIAIIFISLSVLTLGKRFKGRAGKTLSATFGVALTVAFEAWNYTNGGKYTLRALGPYAALFLMVVGAIAAYYLLEKIPKLGKKYAAMISIVIAYYLFKSMVPSLFESIGEKSAMLGALFGLVEVAMIIMVIMLVIKMFGSVFKGVGITKSAAESVEDRLIDEGGIPGAAKDIASRIKEVTTGNRSLDRSLDRAADLADDEDYSSSRGVLEDAISSLGDSINNAIKVNNDVIAQIKALKKQKLTEEQENKLNELIAKLKELETKRKDSVSLMKEMESAAASETLDGSTIRGFKSEREEINLEQTMKDINKEYNELMKDIRKFEKELDKEKKKVINSVGAEVTYLNKAKKHLEKDEDDKAEKELNRVARGEYKEARYADKLIEHMNKRGEDTQKIKIWNNKLKELISRRKGRIHSAKKRYFKYGKNKEGLIDQIDQGINAGSGLIIELRGSVVLKK